MNKYRKSILSSFYHGEGGESKKLVTVKRIAGVIKRMKHAQHALMDFFC